MKLPKPAMSDRQKIHQLFCPSAATCRFRERNNSAGERCRKLDELLDHNDEFVLYGAARKLEVEHDRLTLKGKQALGAGMVYAYELTTPFEEIDPYDPDMHQVPPGAEKYPDCDACNAGRKHFHRKSDQSVVKAVTLEGDESE